METEMEDVSQMAYSVTRAKNVHLRDAINQFRLSELEVIVFAGVTQQEDDWLGEYASGSMFLRFGESFEIPVSITPSESGMMVSSFTDYVGEDEEGKPLTDESWEAIAEIIAWANVGDSDTPCPVTPDDFPVEDRYHAWCFIVQSAYTEEQKASPEIRIILELAQYIAGEREDSKLAEL